MNEVLEKILTGGVAVALITVLGQLLMQYLKERKKDKEKEDSPIEPDGIDNSQYEDKIEVQQIIDRVVMNSSANRFLILKTEGGGGKPRLGNQLYASVLYESIKAPMTSVKDDYQRLLVDDIYVKMLSDIGPGEPNKLVVSAMKDGILKNIYTVEEIEYSEVHYVWECDTAFFYLSIATTEEGNTFDEPLDRVEMEISISKVRDIFRKITEGIYNP